MPAIKISDKDFETNVLKNNLPVLVDFWAEWCGPCKQVGPILEEIANEQAEKLVVAKVNIDDYPDLAAAHHIRSIPTMQLYKNGKLADMRIGALSKSQITNWLQEHI